MADADLLNRAAGCYTNAGSTRDAARCYRAAGAFRRAAAAWEQAGALAEAAADYHAAGMIADAAWILVHDLGDAATARSVLAGAEAPGADDVPVTHPESLENVNRRLASAHCDVLQGEPHSLALQVLEEVTACLEGRDYYWGLSQLERRAVELAESMTRPDLAALVFAAAVRGGQQGAARRWDDWSRQVLHVPLRLPDRADDSATGDPRDT